MGSARKMRRAWAKNRREFIAAPKVRVTWWRKLWCYLWYGLVRRHAWIDREGFGKTPPTAVHDWRRCRECVTTLRTAKGREVARGLGARS